MGEGERVLTMMGFLFGGSADLAQRNFSPAQLKWCEWFEEWLEELGRDYKPSTLKQAKLAWRRLVRQCGKGPWELGRGELERHLRWMEGEGYAAATRANMVGIVSSFYEWMRAKGVEVCNPAEGVRRPVVGRYVGQALLSREEVGRLLRAMRRDRSALGKRDLAFTLARLKTGVPLEALRTLRWRDASKDRWLSLESKLPGEVRGAIWEALEAGGRLEGIRDEDYVFAPLREPGMAGTGEDGEYRAEDWATGKAVSIDALRDGLKLYGRLAGIGEGKLTWMALRRTAVRMRMDDSKEHWGADVREMKGFLGSREGERFTKYRLGKLPGLPEAEEITIEEGRTVERRARPFRPGEGVVHGMYMKSQPPEAVAEILAEKIEGVAEEVAGLRVLERGLVERVEGASRQEKVRLWEAYARAATRLGVVIRAEKAMVEAGKEGREFVEGVDRAVAGMEAVMRARELEEAGVETAALEDEEEEEWGEVGDSPIRRFVESEWQDEDDPDEKGGSEYSENTDVELTAGARRLVEEIAVSRYMLRNVFQKAMEAEETGDYIRMVDLYGGGCVRLVKMLRLEMVGGEEQVRRYHDMINEAIEQVAGELGIEREVEFDGDDNQ